MKHLPFLLILFSFSLFAQQQPQKDLKVGLVLSGGGAKGLAHIGALKVIENAGIHIDYIGGTSMGAIVGSLYAAGYSSKQLDSIFRETNFNTLIQDDLPRGVKTFYEKEDSQRYAVTLPFDNFKLSFPSGLSKGQNVYNLLAQLMFPVRNIHDFSKLPTPFFCIGTDIETGEELILDHGSLPLAVSASGAIPTLFSPVLIDGQLISDGGITDNYPVEEMRKRGVDYIIGVDVQDSLAGRKNLRSAFEILTQVNNFRTINAMPEKRKKTNLYIKPNIKNFSILSFDRGGKIIRTGEVAALKLKSKLDSLASAQHRPQKKHGVKLQDSLSIKNITITGNTNYPRNYIRGKLKIATDQKTSYKKLNEGLDNLSATGNFKRINYKLAPQKNGGNDLQLIVQENDNNMSLRLSLHYDELYKSAALLNLTRKSLLFKSDIASLDLIVGDNFRYKFNYFIDKGNYWSIGFNSSLNKFAQNVGFDFIQGKLPNGNFNVNKVQLDYQDFTNQLYIETFFVRTLRFGLGLEHKYTKLKTETILKQDNQGNMPFTVLEQSNLYSTFGYLEYDDYDKAYFPSHGFHFRGGLHIYLFGSDTSFDFESFSIAKGSFGYAFSPLPRLSVRTQTVTGFRLGDNDMSALDFFLGGYGNHYVNNIQPFFGYDFLSKSGNSFIKTSAQLDYQILPKNHVIAGYNVANIGDNLYDDGKVFAVPDYSGLSFGYGIESFLGPLEVYYSFSPETSRSEWFFSLGFWF